MAKGTINFTAREGFLRSSLKLFSFTYGDFIFEAKINDGKVLIRRNEYCQRSDQYLGDDPCRVTLQWDIDAIACGIVLLDSSTNMNSHLRAVHTPITVPPAEIVNILRKENLLNNAKYNNMDLFFTTLIDSLHFSQEDIRRHGAERLLWKKTNKNVWKPVDEPDISRQVASFLSVYGGLKNFDVTCESVAGVGRMDFHVVAPVGDILRKIAIEAKKAESTDLVEGITTQLPIYMQRIGTDYGIYLVYWLKCPDYPYPNKYNEYGELEIEVLNPIPRTGTIRTIGMNLSKEANPSMQ
ncbi:MAG: hypothetical protein V3U54_01015 [Thermodesulfobacteriota bacterium]